MKQWKKVWKVNKWLDTPNESRLSESKSGTCLADCLAVISKGKLKHAELIRRIYRYNGVYGWTRQLATYIRKQGLEMRVYHGEYGWEGTRPCSRFYVQVGLSRKGIISKEKKTHNGNTHAVVARGERVWADPNWLSGGISSNNGGLVSCNYLLYVRPQKHKKSRDHNGLRRR